MLSPLVGPSYASFAVDLEQSRRIYLRCHARFKRGIQYAAAYRLTH
jgi:hypothetical protein